MASGESDEASNEEVREANDVDVIGDMIIYIAQYLSTSTSTV